MLHLTDLHHFTAIAIQCHDNPDADTIASAFALGRYFELRGVEVKLFYAGVRSISKPNLTLFIDALNIPLIFTGENIGHGSELFPDHTSILLITADCQYGAGNIRLVESGSICVIDHHIKEKNLAHFERIESHLGSCATVVWKLLRQAEFDFNTHPDVSTALYYGLYTDTNSFAELFHPMDKDMIEDLHFDKNLIKILKGNNLVKEELLLVAKALHTTRYDSALSTAIFEADPCDPNILGIIGDLTLQVKGVDVTIGFSQINHGIKLSLRSTTPEVMAYELSSFLTEGYGNGGGNREKAGGFLRLPETEDSVWEFLVRRLTAYFVAYDKIVGGKYVPDINAMRQYRKKKMLQGYVRLTDLYSEGTEVVVRTLEGDAVFKVSQDTYLMIGVQGEAYPIGREKFEKSYSKEDGEFLLSASKTDGFYPPTVKDSVKHEPEELLPHAQPCKPSGETFIFARPLVRSAKVFTSWYTEGYMYGKPGDYLAVRSDDQSDVYIITASIFDQTYDLLPEDLPEK